MAIKVTVFNRWYKFNNSFKNVPIYTEFRMLGSRLFHYINGEGKERFFKNYALISMWEDYLNSSDNSTCFQWVIF